jgi:acyl carrier protein
MDISKTLRKFLIDNFLFEEDENITDETSFLENGILDSTGVLELIAFLEETYGIEVNDEEVIPENLDSIANVVQYIQKKQGSLK